jgi:histidinol-phosphatase (PHP family)
LFFGPDIMMIDYHIHTKLCKHADGEMHEYVESAIRAGLSEIAFTDHIPLPDKFDIEHRMYFDEMDTYLNWIDKNKSQYPEIRILTGIEADYISGYEEFLDDFIHKYHFDIVIMSVHFINNWPNGHWVFNYSFPDKNQYDIFVEYLNEIINGIRTGLFDVLGHADLIKLPGQSLIKDAPEKTDELLKEIVASDMTIEINTSGFRREIQESYPGFDWLKAIIENEISITTGSDAHRPDQIALKFDLLYQELHKRDIHTITGFRNRKKVELTI